MNFDIVWQIHGVDIYLENQKMPQFRLTDRMARELNIIDRGMPKIVSKSYDDWYVDMVRVGRKKVYIFMHVSTRMGVAVPGAEIGGIGKLFNAFPVLLKSALLEHDHKKYQAITKEIMEFFNRSGTELVFTKTDNKSLIRYVADFSFILQYTAHDFTMMYGHSDILPAACDKVTQKWLSYFIKDPNNPKDYVYPKQLVESVFLQ